MRVHACSGEHFELDRSIRISRSDSFRSRSFCDRATESVCHDEHAPVKQHQRLMMETVQKLPFGLLEHLLELVEIGELRREAGLDVVVREVGERVLDPLLDALRPRFDALRPALEINARGGRPAPG